MSIDFIIIQAGGKGSRLGCLTKNKPKGIVPVNNKPIIFDLFDKFPKKKFIIIGDYKFDVLKTYLEIFANVKNIPVRASGSGTCGGLRQALEIIPENQPFLLIWSDLILADGFSLDFSDTENIIGISKEFECRWSHKNGVFEESPSKEHGVAGFFAFKDKSVLIDVPEKGEFVKWLSENESKIPFSEVALYGAKEVGTLSTYYEIENKEYRCRPFNEMVLGGDSGSGGSSGDDNSGGSGGGNNSDSGNNSGSNGGNSNSNTIIKKYLNEQGKQLALREISWYKEAQSLGFTKIPRIYEYEPLTMERINGSNIFKNTYLQREKRLIIDNIIETLSGLHSLKKTQSDKYSVLDAYYTKTINRISLVRDLIPHAERRRIKINGRECRNVFFYREAFYKKIVSLLLCADFAFIHGDCTFSNALTDDALNITLIDPRGYFGFTELYGDVLYDWAKVYYSIFGNYDQFNNRNFVLDIDENEITLSIASNGFEDMAEYFLKSIPDGDEVRIKLIHAIIWLSLTTYAWEDYDSICGAFYNGLYYLEELL